MDVPEIDVTQARASLSSGGTTFVDVRDPGAYFSGRVPGANWLHDGNVRQFIRDADKSKPVVVYCYKGNASVGGAAHLLESGFSDVKSLSGGFEAWSAESGPSEQGAPEIEAPEGFSLTELASTKLTKYLAEEPADTRVRLSVDGGAWGLALDEATGGDAVFTSGSTKIVTSADLAPNLAGLEVGFVEKASGAGFTFSGANPPGPPGEDELLDDVKARIRDNPIMIFIKGTADAPRCGFSAKVVEAMRGLGKPFADKNVLEIPNYRYVLSNHSSWPTIPQIFIGGEFVGGCDIVMELHASGELQKLADAAC
ncbi:MAG: hypothetical protein JKY65_24270 [Planctomycetes bacterium]|nr:hypothetical protein [Planctomycetota bacterium]